ncbi:MAG: tetratricopeptide repeat protein [Anaerolineaceae bacterium]|nr:tetratricopeptide repeat protein [Anaerolineaceae bacterium]
MNPKLKSSMHFRMFLLLLIGLIIIQGCNLSSLIPSTDADTPGILSGDSLIASPAPTVTPTPLPKIRIENAEYKIFTGDYLAALQDYETALAQTNDPAEAALAKMGIGRVHYLLKDYASAVETLEQLIINYSDSFTVANAYYFLALCYRDTQRYLDASAALMIFNSLRPGIIDPTIQTMRGDILQDADDYATSNEAYQAAIDAAPNEDNTALQIEIGRNYAAMGDHINAVRIYSGIYETTTNDYTKAQMNLLSGISYMAMGYPDQAFRVYQDSVTNYPKSYDTYTGLVELVNNNIDVDNLNRGIVDYYAGQYGVAIDVFNRYMDEHPDHDGTPLFYKALCLVESGQQTAAIEIYDVLIEQYFDTRFWESAWDEKAYTQWVYLDQYKAAADTLQEFVYRMPASENAPQYLYDAGRILERSSQLPEAAQVWGSMIDQYPSASESFRALFLSAITQYRLGNFSEAKVAFQRYLALSGNNEDRSAAFFWIAKCEEKLGDAQAAQDTWQQAAQVDPTGYYSERALEVLDQLAPMTPTAAMVFDVDLEYEKSIAMDWMRQTFSIAQEVDLTQMAELAYDDNIRKGDLFWDIGMYEEAVDQYNIAYERYKTDPIQNFRLMNHMLELYMYRPAIFMSRNILDLANFSELDTLTAPPYFNHIRFGTYFYDMVMTSSVEYELEPALLFSTIRQESLFEGFIQSAVGAGGLMQVMPATGDEIFSQLSWPAHYSSSDLYRPVINIPYGAYYLQRQLTLFDGDVIAALASYNGGPGNALAWNELAQNDPDLMLEIIRFNETRNYIFNIAENYHIYYRLYRSQ